MQLKKCCTVLKRTRHKLDIKSIHSMHFILVFFSHHYRIYYALYLHENTSHCTQSSLESAYTANTSGQQCLLKYRFVEEEVKVWFLAVKLSLWDIKTRNYFAWQSKRAKTFVNCYQIWTSSKLSKWKKLVIKRALSAS